MFRVITCLSHPSTSAQEHTLGLRAGVKLVLSEALTGGVNLLPGWQFSLPVQAERDLLEAEAQGWIPVAAGGGIAPGKQHCLLRVLSSFLPPEGPVRRAHCSNSSAFTCSTIPLPSSQLHLNTGA